MSGYRVFSLKSPDEGFSKDWLGGKGFNLWKMAQAGVNVPPAMIIPTDVCRAYMQSPAEVMDWVERVAIPHILNGLYVEFGYMPLVSVRSGARDSMPGMMDTILNVGLCKDNLPEWKGRLGSDCVLNCADRLLHMYEDVVGTAVPASPHEQLLGAIEAVFKSWNNKRAREYRDMYNIPHDLGTAVIVQAMVFGNFNDKSATGVMFTRDPATGVNKVTGEWLPNAQGEDLVAGTHNPQPLSTLSDWNSAIAGELVDVAGVLEKLNGDMQDVEFTVQDGKLFILQTRNGKRTSMAAVQIAVDLVKEGYIAVGVALSRVSFADVLKAATPKLDPKWAQENPPHAVGLGASPGVVVGKVKFSSEAVVNDTSGAPLVLLSKETDPDDVAGMAKAVGILTARGGKTSHAAVVARGMNKVAVVGCEQLVVSLSTKVGERPVKEDDLIALDGESGAVWVGLEPRLVGGTNGAVGEFLSFLYAKHANLYEVVSDPDSVVHGERMVLPAYLYGVAKFEEAVMKLLALPQCEKLVVDLREVSVDPHSTGLAMIWGGRISEVSDKMVSLIAASADKGASKVSVVGVKGDLAKQLGAAGYKVVPTIQSFVDLKAAGGMVLFDAESWDKEQLGVVAEIVAEKRGTFEAVFSFNTVTSVTPEQLEGGAVFALTPILAAEGLLR